MLKVEDLLGKGYFPKELPPPFTSQGLASKHSHIIARWDSLFKSWTKSQKKMFNDSVCVRFSTPKVGFYRRVVSIPNPLHQSILSESICKYWKEIEKVYSESPFTASRPVIDSSGSRSVKIKSTYKEFKTRCMIDSCSHLSIMKADISRYYSTIYTHIIPWAIHGKAQAKKQKADLTLIGNILDRDVRNTQSGQTMGIPIGPDTSLIIAEIISCKIDKELANQVDKLNGSRYYDDYLLFSSDRASSEKTLKCLQSILASYNLDLNEEKTKIERFPIPFEKSWSISLSRFELRDRIESQATDLYRYFSLAFEYAQGNPNESILKYAIKRLEHVYILPRHWKVFQSLLLKSALIEPSVLPEVVRILISQEDLVLKDIVKQFAQTLITDHCFKSHSFEVSWSLWLLRSLNISIDIDVAQKICDSDDPISTLILLDMQDCGLITGSLDCSSLKSRLTNSSFFEDNWILTYESIKKGWLEPPVSNSLSSNDYFSLLSSEGIEFYDSNRQVEKILYTEKEVINNMVMPKIIIPEVTAYQASDLPHNSSHPHEDKGLEDDPKSRIKDDMQSVDDKQENDSVTDIKMDTNNINIWTLY